MKKNMGRIDRSLRLLVAAGAVAGSGVLGFSTAGGIVLLVVAAVMAATAAGGYCPLYQLLGIKTISTGDTATGDTATGDTATGAHRVFHVHRAA